LLFCFLFFFVSLFVLFFVSFGLSDLNILQGLMHTVLHHGFDWCLWRQWKQSYLCYIIGG
jgi:hypothetical protein